MPAPSASTKTDLSIKKYFSEKVITGGLCIIPVILVGLYTYLLITNSDTDLCHPENYSCSAPLINGVPQKDQQPQQPQQPVNPPEPSSSQPQSMASNLEKAMEAAAAAMENATKDNFAPVQMVTSKYSCNPPDLVNGPKQLSSSESKTYKTAAIILIVILILFTFSVSIKEKDARDNGILLVYGSSNYDKLDPSDKTKYKTLWLLVLSTIAIGILGSIYLAKNTIKDTHIGFSSSLVGIFLAIFIFLVIYWPDTDSLTIYIFRLIMAIATILLIIGTAILHTTESDNLQNGFLKTAINNTTMKIVPILMGVVALGNLGAIAFGVKTHKKDKASIVFMIAQGISAILLITCIGFYYDYKSKCGSHSVAICKPIDKPKYNEDGSLDTSIYCKQITGMTISKDKVKNMSIGMCVLTILTQIVGFIAAIMS